METLTDTNLNAGPRCTLVVMQDVYKKYVTSPWWKVTSPLLSTLICTCRPVVTSLGPSVWERPCQTAERPRRISKMLGAKQEERLGRLWSGWRRGGEGRIQLLHSTAWKEVTREDQDTRFSMKGQQRTDTSSKMGNSNQIRRKKFFSETGWALGQAVEMPSWQLCTTSTGWGSE